MRRESWISYDSAPSAGFQVTSGSPVKLGTRVAAAVTRGPAVSPEAYGRSAAAVVTGALRSANDQTRPALQASCGSSASWYSIVAEVAEVVEPDELPDDEEPPEDEPAVSKRCVRRLP